MTERSRSTAGNEQEQGGAARQAQLHEEQEHFDTMAARRDDELFAREQARRRVLAQRSEGPADAYARDLEAQRLGEHISRLRAAESSLCFGRIDPSEGGPGLHVGRIGLRTEEGAVLLVDWRAEAARPFYAATMREPMGLRRRRHLRLSGRRVVDVSDELLDGSEPTEEDVPGDGPLMAALGGARTGRMRQAASTLQAEQDRIVRSPHRGVMVVDGGPGTGKTIVALHRAAYVLYAFPGMAERGVLIYGPNRRFLTYISDVLPSLGENDVQLATLEDVTGRAAEHVEDPDVQQAKGRAACAAALAAWVREHQPDGVPLTIRTAHDTVTLPAGVIDAARRAAVQGGTGHNPARALFLESVVDDLVTALEAQTAAEDEDFEASLKEAYGLDLDRMFARQLADGGGGGGSVQIDWEGIHAALLVDPAIDAVVETVWPRLRAEQVVTGALRRRDLLARHLGDVPDTTLDAIGEGVAQGFGTADLALLDEAAELVDGPPETTYGHVVVDEAQQVSPMQWRMLMRRCPERSMTVVGDLAQAGPATSVRSWDEALGAFVGDRLERHTLTVNYRTTEEILGSTRELLARIAPDQRLSQSLRHGEAPRDLATCGDQLSTLREAIAEQRREHPEDLIGVITRRADAAVTDAAVADTGATVVAAADARGLEFDAVIIVDPASIVADGPAGLRDLYVATTRATSRLVRVVR